jgi:hypothetical protein
MGDIGGAAAFFAAPNAGIADTAEAARPMLLSLKRSRRAESKFFISPAILAERMYGLEIFP